MTSTPEEVGNGPDRIAIGLLRLQQRFEALDRLYNEEMCRLSRDLAQMKADYVRLYQATTARAKSVSRHKRQSTRGSGGPAKATP
jgi:hypothetical protein